jgi:nicotinate-nucleotide adenylyltransferase
MTTKSLRIGLLGGTFNPIHRCHLTVASQTRDRAGLDRILFIPAGDPPHKRSPALISAGHRIQMVRLAIASEPAFSFSDIEVRRPSTSYSIETVQALRAEYGDGAELFFIVGLDAFLDLAAWKQAADLVRLIHFIVVSRPGSAFTSLHTMPLLTATEPASLAELDSGRRERLDLPLSASAHLILLRLPPCDISASAIRARLHSGQSVSNLLPATVESYILHHKLYMEGADRPGIES